MKKLFIVLFSALATTVFAQPFKNGTTTLNAGIGLGTGLGGYGSARPAVSIAVDHGLWEVGGPGTISLGGYFGNTGYKYSGDGYHAKWNYFIIGARGAYHYNGLTKVPELDLYGGLMLSYNIVKYSSDLNDNYFGKNYGSGVGLTGFAGARWFFSDNFGAYGELGYGVSILNVGATFKF